MTSPSYTVEDLIRASVTTNEYLDAKVIASCDVAEPEGRKQIAQELRQGKITLIAPRIYGFIDPIGQLMIRQYHGGRILPDRMPQPHLVALALCRQNGWRLFLPLEAARYFLTLGERPASLPRIPHNQPVTRQYAKIGLELYPAPRDLSHLSPAGQALTIATPMDISEAALRELGNRAALGVMSEKMLLDGMKADLLAGTLGERETIIAQAILNGPLDDEIQLRAPLDFIPPGDSQTIPSVDYWWIFTATDEDRVCTYLAARVLQDHPDLSRGWLTRSSPLIWIDEKLGFARTRSRLYGLGKRMPNSE